MHVKTIRRAKVHGLYRPAASRWGSYNPGYANAKACKGPEKFF